MLNILIMMLCDIHKLYIIVHMFIYFYVFITSQVYTIFHFCELKCVACSDVSYEEIKNVNTIHCVETAPQSSPSMGHYLQVHRIVHLCLC